MQSSVTLVRQSSAEVAEKIADFVQARRVRREVISICEQWLAENSASDSTKPRSAKFLESRYWVLATLAEAHLGLEDGLGPQKLEEALAAAPGNWMKQTTQEQIDKLKILLQDSPLSKLPTPR